MDSHLLPAVDERPLCSEFTSTLRVSPVGSGLRLDRILVATVPLPWPKPALSHPWLKPLNPLLAGTGVATRLFAAEPFGGDELVLELYERAGGDWSAYRWHCEAPHEFEPIVQAIATAPLGAKGHMGMAPIDVTVPTYLVCTQDSHDACCGRFGVALADQIVTERPNYRLRRVSHTGGHRFAPTLLALPSGRMWAWADVDLIDRIAVQGEASEDFVTRCRGWLGATPGPEQVAEVAVRAGALQGALESTSVVVAPGERNDRWDVTVDVAGVSHEVEVWIRREVPSIACQQAGGLPSKVGKDYAWNIKS